MIRCTVRLFFAFASLLGPWSAASAQTSIGAYDADNVIDSLLTFPLPSEDIFWQGEFQEEPPDEAHVVRQAKILTVPGIITYRVYEDDHAAETSLHMRVGQHLPIEGFVDSLTPADPTDMAIYDELVDVHKSAIVGRDLVMFGSDGSYSACVVERNVVVCGFSSLSWSTTPEGGAIMGAIVGLALFLEIANSVNIASDANIALPPTEPTRTFKPTQIPVLIPTLVSDGPTPQPSTELPGDSEERFGRERVAAAAIQIIVISNINDKDQDAMRPLSSGSGTVISPNGLILTNWHVVDAPSLGSSSYLVILLSDGLSPPEPKYVASIVAADPSLDLAVLQIVADADGPIDPATLELPFIRLGDSDVVFLGDQIDIYGYPEMGRGALTFTRGVVSAFPQDQFVPGRAWIATDASVSAGSSGGTAVNQDGELIGVPTEGTDLECRPGDTNGNGQFDTDDVGCVPIGGSLGLLRPSNLAVDLLQEAGWSSPPTLVPTEASTSDKSRTATATPPPTPTPLPTSIPLPTATPSPTPTPTPDPPILQLPDSLPLVHADCFRIEDEGIRTFDEVAARLGGTEEARDHLNALGWRESVYRTFACDAPPDGEVGRVAVHLHLFGSSEAAQQAVDYFAQQLAAGSSLTVRGSAPVGDYAVSLGGPTSNGREFTVYASDGPIMVRVTGVSTTGIPFSDVFKAARQALAAQEQAP